MLDNIPNLNSSTVILAHQLAEQALDTAIDIDRWVNDTDVQADQVKLELFINKFEVFFRDRENVDILIAYVKKRKGINHIKMGEIDASIDILISPYRKYWRRIVSVMIKDPYIHRDFPEVISFKVACLELHSLLLAEIDTLRKCR